MTLLRLGTRGSRLALTQSRQVAGQLEARHSGLVVELVELETPGDRLRDVPLGPHLGQAFFTREIEDALLEGRIDLAVHSCKDLATVMPPGLHLGAVPLREDPWDALVSAGDVRLRDLPPGSRVGTASPRRRLFLAAFRPDLVIQDLRGNVPTRVAAVDEGRVDAVILAVAGLRRLGLEGRIAEPLKAEVMLPAASQGALALQVREDDPSTRALVAVLDDPRARAEVTAERACLRRLGAGCQAPVGVLGRVEGEALDVRAAVISPRGIVRARTRVGADGAQEAGVSVAEELLANLGLGTLRGSAWAGVPPAHGVGGDPGD